MTSLSLATSLKRSGWIGCHPYEVREMCVCMWRERERERETHSYACPPVCRETDISLRSDNSHMSPNLREYWGCGLIT